MIFRRDITISEFIDSGHTLYIRERQFVVASVQYIFKENKKNASYSRNEARDEYIICL